jgi:hypothetical protein
MPPKPIKATAHGLIDYAFVTAFLAGPVALGLDSRIRGLSWLSGAGIGAINAITDHPVGIKPLISLRMHGWLERAAIPAIVAVPVAARALDDSTARSYWLTMLALTLSAHVLTDWEAPADS